MELVEKGTRTTSKVIGGSTIARTAGRGEIPREEPRALGEKKLSQKASLLRGRAIKKRPRFSRMKRNVKGGQRAEGHRAQEVAGDLSQAS